MSKDLTNSSIDRKNILNNNLAIQEVYEQVGFYGIKFDGKYRFTKQQVAQYFEVDIRTIDRLLENHKAELEQSGYEVYTGVKLKEYKEQIIEYLRIAKEKKDVPDIHVGNIEHGNDIRVVTIIQLYENEIDSLYKTSVLGTFTYKAFLNIGMLITGSEKAQRLRSAILDIVIDILNKRLGGKTKYINQREEEFLPSAIREYNYRKEFTNALIHQDLTEKGFPMVEIFSDRIEISNPGTPLVTPDRFIDAYLSRNEKLADLMRRMGFCEEKGSGLDKVIFYNELYQLPAINVVVAENRTRVTMYCYKTLNDLDKKEKIRACYQHACLKYVSNEKMTNQSLRERFKIEDQNAAIASRIIRDALEDKVIKEDDPESKSRKYASYIPFWA